MKRFRKVPGRRPVEHTIGGQTFEVYEDYEVKQVVQPVDLDQMVHRALILITFVVVSGALVWSTVAIGSLLATMAPAWVSLMVAVVFDLTWVACMAAEWLMRYDSKRADIPRRAGWAALAVSVGAIAVHGAMVTGKPVIGSAGGIVSVLAKGLWMVVMLISARRLSPLDQQWYEKASSAADAQLALIVAQRKLARTQARAQQEKAALDAFRQQPEVVSAAPFVHETPALEPGSHSPVVYVVRNGNRVKIGTTTHLRNRVKALSLRQSDILLTLDGGPDEERDLHRRFAGHRIGTSEWFDFVPEIRDFVRDASGTGNGGSGTESAPSPGLSRDELGPKRDLTELVRDLRTQGLDEKEIKERVRDEIPDVKADSLRKAVQRTRTA